MSLDWTVFMAMLSNLLRYKLVDKQQRHARLTDLAVDLSAGDYPPVTDLLVLPHGSKTPACIPGRQAGEIDGENRVWHVEDLAAAEPATAEWLAQRVLLKRDVLDALVLDLEDRLVYRANDLEVEEEDGKLALTAVDVSLRAILRRLTRGLIRWRSKRFIRDWRSTEYLRGDPEAARRGEDYHGLIARLPAGEIADLADALPYLHAAELITLLPVTKAADTLESMTPERQLQVFDELDEELALGVLALMRPDIVADLMGRLDTARARHWLERMAPVQFRRVLRLLSYQEDTAGGIMTNDLITLPNDMPAGVALDNVREQLRTPAFINFIETVYIVDRSPTPKLLGVLPLRELLTAEPEQLVEAIMDPYVVTVHPNERAKTAARRVMDSDLPALPVVGQAGELLGAITVDSALQTAVPGWGPREAPRLFS